MELNIMVKEIYSQITELNNEVVDNGRGIHEIRSQLVAAKPTRVDRTQCKDETEKVIKDRGEMFMTATGRRITTKITEQQRSKETVTYNRFSLLADEEEETVIIGDSMVKSQKEKRKKKEKEKLDLTQEPVQER